MKKLFTPLFALLFAFSLGSCDKVSDLADIDIPLSLTSEEVELDIPSGKTSGDNSFADKLGSIDLFQGELADYKNLTDKIRKFNAEEITVNIIFINPSTGVSFTTPSVVTITGNSGSPVSFDFSGEELTAGKKIVLDKTKLSQLNDILNERKSFNYKVSGGFNQSAKGLVSISVKGKVTVNVLK